MYLVCANAAQILQPVQRGFVGNIALIDQVIDGFDYLTAVASRPAVDLKQAFYCRTGKQQGRGHRVRLPLHPFIVGPVPGICIGVTEDGVRAAPNHRYILFRFQQGENGQLVRIAVEALCVEDPVARLVSLRKPEPVFLLLVLNQPAIDDHSVGVCMDVLCPSGVRIIHRKLVRLVENRHPQIDPVMGEVLEVRGHAHIQFQKSFDVERFRAVQGLLLKILNEAFSDSVNVLPAENRDAVALFPKMRSDHLLLLPLPFL